MRRHLGMALGLVLAAWTWAAGPGPCHAQTMGLVVLDPGHAPVPARDVMHAMARAAGRTGATMDVEPFARARSHFLAGAVPAPRLAAFREARALAVEGWRAYLAVDTEVARARLEAARSVAKGVLDLDGGFALHADISLRLGAVFLQLGRPGEAREAFLLARALDPDREVSIAEFSPDVVEAHQAARPDSGRVAVTVTTEPAGARIEVNGQDMGTAPLTIELGQGAHVVVARAKGHVAMTQVIQISAQEPRQVAMTLAHDPDAAVLLGTPEALAVGTTNQAAIAAIQALLRYGELDSLVMVASIFGAEGPALLGQACSGIPARCTAIMEIRYTEARATRAAAMELWAALHAAPRQGAPEILADKRLGRPARPLAATAGGSRRACAWCRSRWFWIGIGAAALTAGAAIWATDRGDTRPVITLDPCEFGGCP